MNPSGLYERKIVELRLVLPPAAKPAGSYQPVVVAGNLAFVSGQLCRKVDGALITGKIGKDLDKKAGMEAAHEAALNLISTLKEHVGLHRVKQIVKLTGFVQASENFNEISAVVNGASDLLGVVFGAQGIHARTSVGVASLPQNAAVEIDAVVEINPA